MTTVHGEARRTGWTVDDSTFGARLALVRQQMDWNIKEAAVACGLPPASWRSWERDGAQPRQIIRITEAISEKTGCDFGWLLAGKRLTGSGRTDRDGNTLWYSIRGERATPKVAPTAADHPAGATDRPTAASSRPPRGPRRVSTSPGTRRPAVLPRPNAA